LPFTATVSSLFLFLLGPQFFSNIQFQRTGSQQCNMDVFRITADC
jgi:hypothetical protein